MAAQVGKFAANKLLKKQMKNYKDKKVDSGDDPYFAMVEDRKHPGKFTKKKKLVPAYIPQHDADILAAVRRRAYRLDMCLFNFLGIRFGWEAVIGLIPFAGDAIGVAMALMVYKTACKVDGGLNSQIRMRMLINIALDFAVGLVPFIGDLADAAFKCNTRNLRLLEEVLDKKYKPSGMGRDERDAVGEDKEKRRRNRASGIYHPHDPPPATAFEEIESDEDDYVAAAAAPGVQRPEPARARDDMEMRQAGRSAGGGGGAPPPPRQETGRVRRG